MNQFLNFSIYSEKKHQFTTGDVTAQPQTGRGHEKHTSHRLHSNKEVCRADKIFQHLNHAAAYVKYYRAPPSWYTRWRATPFRLLEHNGSSEKTEGKSEPIWNGDGTGDASRSIGALATEEHYAQRTQALKAGWNRTALQIHQNWVTTVLLHGIMKRLLISRCSSIESTSGAVHVNVRGVSLLDLCCGRGGDLHKYAHYAPFLNFVVCADS